MDERNSFRFGKTTIEYAVTRSARRKKTIQITLDPYDGVLVAAPMRAWKKSVEAFVRDRADWIVQKIGTSDLTPPRRQLVSGEELPYLGRSVPIVIETAELQTASVRFSNWEFTVQVLGRLSDDDRRLAIESAFEDWYRRQAGQRLPTVVDRWALRMGSSPTGVLIRGQRRRWGSCSADGTIRLNWRVVMAEPALIDYVVVHELLHLKVQNHSRDYWNALAQVMPDYLQRRQRLKDVGPYLTI